MPTLAAAAIARDEARDLPGWIANVLRFADEAVVVVDAATTDATREILRDAEAAHPGRIRWTERAMDAAGFAAQRNAALGLASVEWVLHMDIDMRATPELGAEVREAIRDDSRNAFRYRLLNHFLHHPVRGGGWARWNKAWLGRRGAHRFANAIHEVTEVDGGDAATGQLRGRMWHLNDQDYVERVGKNLRYMQGSGRAILRRGVRVRWYHLVGHPVWRAVRTYALQGGWRDGTQGVVHAMYTLTSTFNWWAFAWDEQNRVPRADLEQRLDDAWALAPPLREAAPPPASVTPASP